MRKIVLIALVAAAAVAALGAFTLGSASAKTPDKPLPRVVVYVESQGLCYDSIVTAQNLPDRGRFQTLAPDLEERCGEDSLITEFGPGDQGYVGGRWELTMPNGDVVHFVCPLLGPGEPPAP
jgi:hypothetical protein